MTDEAAQDHQRPWRLGVLISGSGRTLANLVRVIDAGELDAEIVAVVSSAEDVRGLEIAAHAGIPTDVVMPRQVRGIDAYSRAIYDAFGPFAPDMLIMAGFLRRLLVAPGWKDRILNIHPALLPDAAAYASGRGFYGERVHAAVLAHGDAISGATVHVVTDRYDEGPPLMRAEVPVLPNDDARSLAARVFIAETTLYPAAIRAWMDAHPELKRG